LVAPTGIEPVLSALKGPRVNQLHHGAVHNIPPPQPNAVCSSKLQKESRYGSVTGIIPGLFTQREAFTILDGYSVLRKTGVRSPLVRDGYFAGFFFGLVFGGGRGVFTGGLRFPQVLFAWFLAGGTWWLMYARWFLDTMIRDG
jgi:hypothetical protein